MVSPPTATVGLKWHRTNSFRKWTNASRNYLVLRQTLMIFVFTVVTEKRTIEILQMFYGSRPNKLLSIRIKILITNAPVLAYFDHNKPITTPKEASKYGLGWVLLQNGKPVGFASKSLTTTEVKSPKSSMKCSSHANIGIC